MPARSDLWVLERPAEGRRRGVALLVHGTMDRSSSFIRLMSRLREWDIISYDRRGYGRSHHVAPSPDFDVQVQDLLGVLAGRPAPDVAFGHSFGGDVVLATMAARPDLIPAALVWEPPQPWLGWWPSDSVSRGAGAEMSAEDRAEWFMRRMVGDQIWERLPVSTREQRRAEGPALSAELKAIYDKPAFEPGQVRGRVLVGRGGRSRIHHRRAVRELASALPSGRLVEIADAEHGVHLSHPGEAAALLAEAAGVGGASQR